jgi:asparagine synthase (glutamine-hydrolysing)
MCGIIGILTQNKHTILPALQRAEQGQRHRGPNSLAREILSVGSWHVGISHQRLSILDLSDAGKQPMYSASRKSVIVYNGEVYNYKELAQLATSSQLRTGTDTEIILEMLERHGPSKSLPQFNGMWAFGLVDLKNKKLLLSRDRMGVKPLYYCTVDGDLFFASEVKALLAATQKKFRLNYEVICEYIDSSLQDTTEASFFEGINSFPAGHFAELDLEVSSLNINPVPFWDLLAPTQVYTFDEAVEFSRETFQDAVRLRLRSDVPVGVTLSGGLDSSSIAAMMVKNLGDSHSLNVISAVSPGSAQDESAFIDIMTEHLKCPVHKVVLDWTAEEALGLMRTTTWHNDSPLGSFSNIAHYLLMKKAHDLGITVILSGQGADELLCGYKKYLGFYIQHFLRHKHLISATRVLSSFICNGTILSQFGLQEAKRYLPAFRRTGEIDIRGPRLQGHARAQLGLKTGQSMSERQAEDINKFSVPFLTHYEDRMSMAWAREIRLPFLDYRLVNMLVNLPTDYKLREGWTKFVFRKAMDGLLPKQITWRKDKQGFVNPQEEWLRGPLRDKVLDLFSEDALIFKSQLIDRKALLMKYDRFCRQSVGKGTVWYREIFNPLALEIWLQTFENSLALDAC